MLNDLKYTLRSLTRARGFSAAVILTLALGIGANTAIFSVVRGVMLKPLPHRGGDRLMYLRQSADGPGHENVAFSVPEINDFRQTSKTLGGIAEYSNLTLTFVTDNDASRINVGLVTGNYLSIMGLKPILGRDFGPGDDGPSAAPVMMLTYDYWMKRFGGDPKVVGQSYNIGGKPVLVIGVSQPAPYFPTRIDALMNMVNSAHHVSATMVQGRTHRMTEMIARLAPTANVEQARKEVADITKRVHGDHPEAYDKNAGYKVTLTPFREVLGQRAKTTLWLLMGAAAFVLIIACANVANLTMMRGVRREQELVVRAALGAGTRRLRALLLVENIVLAAAGALLGLAVAFAGVRLLISFAARYSPRATEISIDGVVLAFTIGLAIVVAILLSFAPKLATENSLGASLGAARRGMSGGSRRHRLQQSLVVAQVAVSVILLTGAGLLTRTMQRLAMVETGMDTGNVLTMETPSDFNGDPLQAISKYQLMRRELAALPGVKEVGLGSTVPLRSAGFQLEVKAEDRPVDPGRPIPQSEYRTASPAYFKAAGIPILKGREFTANDDAKAPKVVVLNQSAAELLFGNVDPIGRRVTWTGEVLKFIGMKEEWRTVVGVVGDTKDNGLDGASLPATFLPFEQGAFPQGAFVIRTQGSPMSIAPAASKVIHGIDPKQPIDRMLTIDQIRDESVGPRRLNAQLVGSFGILALIVAAIGIAAVLAFSVSARTNEIGIRMSLGADAGKVQRMFVSEGGVLVIAGLVIGTGGAIALSRLIKGFLYGVNSSDPLTLIAVFGVMAAVGLTACWIPAMRAAKVDPGIALRAQ
jgi:putative ABC transport system permease protein